MYTNTGSYTISPSSGTTGGIAGDFAVTDGTNFIAYTVRLNDTVDGSSGSILTNGEVSSVLSTNQTIPYSPICNNGDNAALYLEMQGADLQAAPPSNYSGTLTLTVAPI